MRLGSARGLGASLVALGGLTFSGRILRSGSESGVGLERGLGGFETRLRFLASWISNIESGVLDLVLG